MSETTYARIVLYCDVKIDPRYILFARSISQLICGLRVCHLKLWNQLIQANHARRNNSIFDQMVTHLSD